MKITTEITTESQDYCEQESIERMSKPIKERFLWVFEYTELIQVLGCILLFVVILLLIFSKTIQ